MAEKITEFRNRNAEPKVEKSTQSKINRHKRLKFYKFVAIITVVIAVTIFLYVSWKNQVYSNFEVTQANSWERAEGTSVIQLNGYVLVYSSNGMSLVDTKGRAIWNQTYEIQKTIVRTCKNVVAIGDYNGRKIYIADTSKILGTVETPMPIRDLSVAANGVVAAVLDDDTVTSIYLYSTSGEQLVNFKTTMSKSGYPIDLTMSDDGSQVAVSYLKTQKGQVSSDIGFYNFSSVGQNYTDNLVAAHGYLNSVIPFMTFMGNDAFVAVADNRLMFFKGKQIPHNTNDVFLTEQIQAVYNNKNYIGLVYYGTDSESLYKMDVYNSNGVKTQTIPININYKDIILGNEGIIIYSDNECMVVDWNGKTRYKGIFEQGVECVIATNKINRYIIVTQENISTVELK